MNALKGIILKGYEILRLALGRLKGIRMVPRNYLFKGTFDENDSIVDAGCGDDADFSLQMIKTYGVRSFGIDPTLKHVESLAALERSLGGKFVHKRTAISDKDGSITFNESVENVSGSVVGNHRNVKDGKVKTYEVQSVTLASLPAYLGLSRIPYAKFDLEGAEYGLFTNLKKEDTERYGQIFVEFHHHCTSYTRKDTDACVGKMKSFGWNVFTADDNNYLFYR